MSLRNLHRLNAKILRIFILLHFANHSVLLLGRESHLALMETLRQFYRLGFVEYPLVALFAAQIILGVSLILKRGKPKGSWAWAQVISGGYIVLFLLQHLGAIVMARISYNFETTTYFAAGVVSGLPYGLYFFRTICSELLQFLPISSQLHGLQFGPPPHTFCTKHCPSLV
ncbi:hypothetical protein [Planktotalea sp.]|uniref:hypothetical protein n=1 Tax=Planktotalea sp. TaxID=2029877 RepID=UPI0025DEB16C|nr:hypothetical protein [Planktotalea sp.]